MPRTALLLGAGGAARAAIAALVARGIGQVTVANRHLARAERLATSTAAAQPHLAIRAVPWHEELLVEQSAHAGIVVHATSVGLPGSATASHSPLPAAAFRAGQYLLDVVYATGETPIVSAARAAGAEAADGREMLLLQGAA